MDKKILKFKNFFLVLICFGIFGMAESSLAATIDAASCSQADVQAAINFSSDGDTVSVPEGNCVWGNSGTYINVNKAITLQGENKTTTIINIATTAGAYTGGTIRLNAAAVVKDLTIQTAESGNSGTAFSASAGGFRISNIDYTVRTTTINGYFLYTGAYGLVDNCTIIGGAGNDELIFARGPANSWQTPHSIGGADNLFIENNTFGGLGYVCDINSNGRAVLRYNTITGPMKIDGHGKASNTPARGVRHMEVYGNKWTNSGSYWMALELRGGGGRVYDNVIQTSATVWVRLTDYAATATWPNFNNTCQCPANYPIDDQIGAGMDPKVGGSEPMYLWNNTKNGTPWAISWPATTNCTATCGVFSMTDIIRADRDYFISDTKPAAMSNYVPYACPHPLTGLAGSCDSSVAGIAGYNIDASDIIPPAAPSGLSVN